MSEKTEQPTPKRIRDSREKGDICKGQDIAPAATVLAFAVYALANGEHVYEVLVEMLSVPFAVMHLPFDEALAKAAPVVIGCAVEIVAPVVGLVMGVALASLLAQTGFLFAPKAAMPKLENLNPAKWFKRVFSVKNVVELLKNIFKVTVLGAIAGRSSRTSCRCSSACPKGGSPPCGPSSGRAVGEILLMSSGAFAVVAALDFLYQKYKWTQDHMMSIDEVKREYKESEGDPMVKSRRKQLAQEMLNQNTVENVRKAKVLVTNPTHYAVALDYDKDETPLPVILRPRARGIWQRA